MFRNTRIHFNTAENSRRIINNRIITDERENKKKKKWYVRMDACRSLGLSRTLLLLRNESHYLPSLFSASEELYGIRDCELFTMSISGEWHRGIVRFCFVLNAIGAV